MIKPLSIASLSAIVLSSAVMTGCASPGTTYNVIIPYDIPFDWQAAVIEGVNGWMSQLGEGNSQYQTLHLTYMIGAECSGADYEICIHSSTREWMENNGATASSVAFTHHVYLTQHSDIYFALDYYNAIPAILKAQSMSHELGHAMDLNHTQKGTMMCWETFCSNISPVPSCDDLQQYMEIRGQSKWETVNCPAGDYNYQLEN